MPSRSQPSHSQAVVKTPSQPVLISTCWHSPGLTPRVSLPGSLCRGRAGAVKPEEMRRPIISRMLTQIIDMQGGEWRDRTWRLVMLIQLKCRGKWNILAWQPSHIEVSVCLNYQVIVLGWLRCLNQCSVSARPVNQASQPASSVNTQGGPQVQPASHDNIMTPLTFTLHTTTNTITSPLSSLSPNWTWCNITRRSNQVSGPSTSDLDVAIMLEIIFK